MPMTYDLDPDVPSGCCGCREARLWRAYWSPRAIAERLRLDLDGERKRCHDRWTSAMNDVRGLARIGESILPNPGAPSHAELARRRRE